MKKKLLIILTALIVLVLVGVMIFAFNKKLKTYTKISYNEYIKKVDNGETFPLVIGSSSCSACAVFEGTMDLFIKKYQVKVFFIDITELTEEQYTTLKTNTSFDGTPTTVFYEAGKITSYYNRIDGAESLTNVEDKYRINKYID